MMPYLRPGQVVVIVGMTLTSLSTLVVGLRYWCRWYRMGTVGATDHLMMVALVVTWGNTVLNYYQDETSRKYRPSFFRNPVQQAKHPHAEEALRGNLIAWYTYRMSYGVGLCFVKLSILFFYRAIATNRTFRRMVYCTIYLVILYTLGSTIASAFQCEDPARAISTEGYLAQFDRARRMKLYKQHFVCYDPVVLWVFTSAINLFTDVLIMALPIPTLLGLRVPMNKRLALVGIFCVGSMAIVASCVRMWVMALWSESPENSAKFGSDLLLWGQVETNAGIISASVPFLRLFFAGRGGKDAEEKGVVARNPRGRKRVREIVDPDVGTPQAAKVKEGGRSELMEMDGKQYLEARNEKALSGGRSPVWRPFITMPHSLSSRGSGTFEESQKEYMTV